MVGQDLVAPSVPGNGHAASHWHGTGSPGWVSDHGGGSDAAVVGHLPRDPACSVQTSNPGAAREHDRGFLPSDTNPPARLRSHFLRLRRCCPRPKAAPSCSWCSHGPLQSQMLRAARAQPTEAPPVCYGGAHGAREHPGAGGRLAAPPTATKPRKVAGLSSVCSLWVCLSVALPASKKSQVLRRAREKVLVNKCVTAEVLLGSAAAG